MEKLPKLHEELDIFSYGQFCNSGCTSYNLMKLAEMLHLVRNTVKPGLFHQNCTCNFFPGQTSIIWDRKNKK